MPEVKLCGRCKQKPAVNNDQAYCRECRNEYQKDYNDSVKDLAFGAGVKAMRDSLALAFSQQPADLPLGCIQIANIIRTWPSPVSNGKPG